MSKNNVRSSDYNGFELGPIRPPSEAASLMLRVTRNCPWNKCKFCGLYRGETFSVRAVEHLKYDIDQVKHFIDQIQLALQAEGDKRRDLLVSLKSGLSYSEQLAFHSAYNWLQNGMSSVFLQDANSLVVKPDDLVDILRYLRLVFPMIDRVTTYARSHSVARVSDADMQRLAAAGLNRIHIGMESGADEVLEMIRKGVDQQTQIIAGQKVKRAGIELSEYFMPGLGGKEFSSVNAISTADAINQINPDYIRIRTLAIPRNVDLFQDVRSGAFTPLNDIEAAAELLLFLDNLDQITSMVKSDHILNLFQEVEGQFPDDREVMTEPLRTFMTLPSEEQLLYRVGRRCGIFSKLTDLYDDGLRSHAENALLAHRVNPDNIESWTAEMVQRFI